jgi:sulfatase maturation enzyme AslB (radical SAM superfamily)
MTPDHGDRVWIWMDVSASCNLACRDCYTKHIHAPALMTVEGFTEILKRLVQASLSIEKLHLNWRGEPLTNKRFTELLDVRRTIAPKVPLEFHTNGLLLTDVLCEAIVERLMADDLVYVSIDGGGIQLHEANRGGGTWAPTLKGLRRLLDAKDRYPGRGPNIGIYEISYGRKTNYDDELIALSRRCDMWTRVSPIDRHGHESPFAEVEVPHGPCFWAGNSMCITARGDVHVCMLSFDDRGVLGNMFVDDIHVILQRAREFRFTLTSAGRSAVGHCRGCHKTEGAIDS